MRTNVAPDDEGKRVTYHGDKVARVVEVERDTAYIDQDHTEKCVVKKKNEATNRGA